MIYTNDIPCLLPFSRAEAGPPWCPRERERQSGERQPAHVCTAVYRDGRGAIPPPPTHASKTTQQRKSAIHVSAVSSRTSQMCVPLFFSSRELIFTSRSVRVGFGCVATRRLDPGLTKGFSLVYPCPAKKRKKKRVRISDLNFERTKPAKYNVVQDTFPRSGGLHW